MADVRFYHIERSTLDQVLPSIALKAWQSGKKVMVLVSNKKESSRLNDLLWTFHPNVFLPHGMAEEKHSERQPVLLTDKSDNLNGAEILIMTQGCVLEDINDFTMVCEILDGKVENHVMEARTRWKTYKEAGHELTYWQQDENGKWNKK